MKSPRLGTLRARLLGTLEANPQPQSIPALMRALHLTLRHRETVYVTLQALTKDGHIVRCDKGIYTIPGREPAQFRQPPPAQQHAAHWSQVLAWSRQQGLRGARLHHWLKLHRQALRQRKGVPYVS